MYRRLRQRFAPPAATGAAAPPADEAPEVRASMASTIDAEHVELSGLRSEVVEFSERNGADADLVADLELLVSELATNVVRHTPTSNIETTLSVGDNDATSTEIEPPLTRRWVLTMSGADDLPGLEGRVAPDADQADGRGLLVVRAIVDEFEITAGKAICTLLR